MILNVCVCIPRAAYTCIYIMLFDCFIGDLEVTVPPKRTFRVYDAQYLDQRKAEFEHYLNVCTLHILINSAFNYFIN